MCGGVNMLHKNFHCCSRGTWLIKCDVLWALETISFTNVTKANDGHK